MSYKPGDKVVIISQRGITWNQDGEMDIWQGKVMTIDKIGFTIPGKYTRYTMVEDEGKWAWNNLDIDDEATKKLEEKDANS